MRRRNWRLYVITDTAACKPRALEDAVRLAIQGGASVIQLRDKLASDESLVETGRRLLPWTRRAGVPLLVNDRPAVAKRIGADGVHLGQDDGDLAGARAILGADAIYGRSTHSRDQALEAEREGFDYVGIGPVYVTPTKPTAQAVGLDLVRFAAARLRIPFVAIGGIDVTNLADVLEAGARTVAVVRAVMGSDQPEKAAEQLVSMMKTRSAAKKSTHG